MRYLCKMSVLALASMHVCVSICKLFFPILIAMGIISSRNDMCLTFHTYSSILPVCPAEDLAPQAQELCRHLSGGEHMVWSHGKHLGNFSAVHDDHA